MTTSKARPASGRFPSSSARRLPTPASSTISSRTPSANPAISWAKALLPFPASQVSRAFGKARRSA
jgi:hypothetical protein